MEPKEKRSGEQIIAFAAARRSANGLKLTFQTPDLSEPFVCYPKDDEQKQKWLASAKRKGWAVRVDSGGNG